MDNTKKYNTKIDNLKMGQFISELRKSRQMTQKLLAESR